MGKKFLIDTNIIIYYVNNLVPEKEKFKIIRLFTENFSISIISKIEFLGWKRHTEEGFIKSKEFLSNSTVYPLDEEIANTVILLRREHTINLGDSIIAATAIHYNCTLVTKNAKDFKGINQLKIYNPFS